MRSILTALLVSTLGGLGVVSGAFDSIYVIAPSVSTRGEAHVIMRENKWTETSAAREADAILVIVRSGLSHPMSSSYDSLDELRQDAANQLNLLGPRFHVYVYKLEDDQSVSELKHLSYDAESAH